SRLLTRSNQLARKRCPPDSHCDISQDNCKAARRRPKHADITTMRDFRIRKLVKDQFVVQTNRERCDQKRKRCDEFRRNRFSTKEISKFSPFTIELLMLEHEGSILIHHRIYERLK